MAAVANPLTTTDPTRVGELHDCAARTAHDHQGQPDAGAWWEQAHLLDPVDAAFARLAVSGGAA
ncbi:hypothetical protein AQ490_06470 [Wenjunlia vitaminophila]|uniref:Uncharacterized protein n=1 Tax=Wenjunlia vitaminophila TaxID=76728 RepID=A0A0T6LN74_WENVI|nr:hypothetical protein AQ490_06470 [Wenjunlia vitaminophila]